MTNSLELSIPTEEIERRKEAVRALWNYEPVDHIPINMRIMPNPNGYCVTEQFADSRKQLELNLLCVRESLRRMPDDYIPILRPDMGCMMVATMFGAEVVYGEHPEGTPWRKEALIYEADQVYDLQVPDPYEDGLMPQALERIEFFMKETDYQIPTCLMDMGGPMNAAKDLVDTNLFYLLFYDDPKAMHHLLELLAETYLRAEEAMIDAAGGMDNVVTTDWDPTWCPEGRRGYVSDDVCATHSAEIFREFSKPVNNRIFRRYGGGLLHNCGPHPCVGEYLSHDPRIKGCNMAYDYSVGELARIREAFQGEGIVYMGLSGMSPGCEGSISVEQYRRCMEELAPEVACVPQLWVDPANLDVSPEELYRGLRKVSEEYASRMEWR